jgi:membrane fusion protein (multidrug efflux system)
MSRAPALWLALGIAALALGGGGYHFLSEDGVLSGANAEAAVAPAVRAVAVEAERVTVDTVIEDIHAVGSLQPNEAIAVSSEVAGRINEIRFSEGDEVAAGDVLVELDDTILRAELAKARAEINLAEANRTRAMTLAKQGTGTLRARDEAIAGHLAAQANVALAQARLDKTTVVAPFSGVVGLRAVSVGA